MLEALLPESFQWWHLILLFSASLIGESFGAIIGGGSIVTQPALLLTGTPLASAIAIDNAGALGTEAGILSEAHREVRKRWKMTLFMFAPMILGGILGTYSLLNASTGLIKPIMIGAVLFLLLHSHFLKGKLKFLDLRAGRYAVLFGFLFLVGAYNNFIGVGEGTFAKLGIMLIFGLTFVQVQGFKTTATIPIRIYSLIVTALAGLIVWPYLLSMWAGSFIAGRYSTKYAKRIPDRYLRYGLTVVALLFIAYLILFV
ncbi:sulfite exporter TauE/SafE family protein [Candidatus Saccharibacteria bacterium]|nr:sulfite exporter TauE/SafE family protein [Candidatus Saccharibacteria bacterium]